jgi:hypothetical protein
VTILDYHRLQREERAGWDPVRLEAAVRAQDPGFPEHVERLLPSQENKAPVPAGSPRFQQLQNLCGLWLAATAEQRAYIRSKMDSKRAHQLGAFRHQATQQAAAGNSEPLLRIALASLAIDDLSGGDSRDAILSVQALLKAARAIHADWGKLVRGVAALAGPGMAALLEDFLRNHPA